MTSDDFLRCHLVYIATRADEETARPKAVEMMFLRRNAARQPPEMGALLLDPFRQHRLLIHDR